MKSPVAEELGSGPGTGRTSPGARLRGALAPLAGPALIVVAVLVILAPFAFGERLTTQHVDILPLWLPTHCYLGSQLAAGHVPAWNPFVMGGARFAADPQSGWLYLPAMLIDTALPCARALGWFITLQPIIGGLGLYAFLRGEGAVRAAATVGGITLALSMAASLTVISLPLAAAVAWSAVTLAAASRLVRATEWTPRLLWLLGTAIAWGQLASAHMSQGLLIGTAALAVYMLARVFAERSVLRRRAARSVGLAVLLVVALPLVNLGILLPRIQNFETSSLASGYKSAEVRAARLEGLSRAKPVTGEIGAPRPGWPLAMAVTPGSYLGVAALALVVAGLWSRRHRPLVVAFIAFGALCYVLSLRSVAVALSSHVGGNTLGDVYLHTPARLRFGVLLAAPLLSGLGADAWRERASPLRRLWMVVPGLVLFGVLPTLLGYRWGGQLIPLLGLLGAGAALALAAARPRALWVIPAVLALELTANGLAGQAGAIKPTSPRGQLRFGALGELLRPDVDTEAYLRAGPIAKAIRSGGAGRYLPLDQAGWQHRRGFLTLPGPRYWALYANQRSMLFHIEDVGGSDNPVQSYRYWSFVRAVTEARPLYNAAFFTTPSRSTADLMQIRWIIQRAGRPPPAPNAAPVTREGPWRLYRLTRSPGRASVVDRWTTVASQDQALRMATAPSFVPGNEAVLETAPTFPRSASTATPAGRTMAQFRWLGPQAAVIRVSTPRPAILLVRNTFDPGWHATVDGRPVAVQPADYVAQGVPIPAGRHVVELRYDDPSIGYGLLGSVLAIVLLVGSAAMVRSRTGRGQAPASPEPGSRPPRSLSKTR